MTAAQFRERFGATTAKAKYGNKKTIVDGITFDSRAEAHRYCELKQMLQAGEIQGFTRQPSFVIAEDGTRYRPDFMVCGKDGSLWVEDVKGFSTAAFKLKQTMWKEKYPWLPLKIIR